MPACGGKAGGIPSPDAGPSRGSGSGDAGGTAQPGTGSTGGDSVSGGLCSGDPSVHCSGSAQGFTCTGDAPPPSSQDTFCSAAVAGADDATSYCCETQPSGPAADAGPGETLDGGTIANGCIADATVVCAGPQAQGYSCSGTSAPGLGQDLACSIPQASGALEDYCCFDGSDFSSSSCASADLEGVCSPGAYAFRCDDPFGDPTSLNEYLTCTDGTPDADGASTDFCCSYM